LSGFLSTVPDYFNFSTACLWAYYAQSSPAWKIWLRYKYNLEYSTLYKRRNLIRNSLSQKSSKVNVTTCTCAK